ncbi:MAG: acyl--CoA ligase [Candidatus Acidiferrales bacterium]
MVKSTGTLLDIFQSARSRHTAVVVPELGLRVSYSALHDQAAEMARTLAGAGIGRGDRVAIALPNGLPAIVTFLAACMAGAAAPLNPAYRHDEFNFFLGDTDAKVLVCPEHGGEEASRAATDCGIPVLTAVTDSHGAVHLHGPYEKAAVTAPSKKDVALVLHTSGSTGRPKRVPLWHVNLLVSAHNIAHTYVLTPEDVSLCVMPLFHVHGLVASTLATLLSGGTVVAPKKFEALSFWRLVKEYNVTWYSGVPTIHQLLLARAGSHGRPPGAESLRFARSCSTSLSAEIMHKMEELLGVPLLEAYGMTEAAHQMTSNPLPPRVHKPGSVGVPAGPQVSVIDAHGHHLRTDRRGEVVVRGPNVFEGYENDEGANSTSFTDGWFRTGDEGFLDQDGYLHLTGRLKEQINRAGEKISPHEIDRVLLRHPAVCEAVTFGFWHPKLNEEVAAAVVLREPVSESALLKFCGERLAEFKCPKKLFFVDNIPQTATGKIRRSAVAAALVPGKKK